MEIRKNGNGNNRQLYFTKGNYLPEDKKKEALELMFNDKQEFTFSGVKAQNITGNINSRIFTPKEKSDIMNNVKKYRKLDKDISIDNTLKKLREDKLLKVPSKGTLSGWLKGVQSTQTNT